MKLGEGAGSGPLPESRLHPVICLLLTSTVVLQAADAAYGFTLLPGLIAALLALAGLFGLSHGISVIRRGNAPRLRRPPLFARLAVLMAATVIILAGVTFSGRAGTIESGLEAERIAASQMAGQADRLQADFRRLTDRISQPLVLGAAGPAPGSLSREAFDWLEQIALSSGFSGEGAGLTLYDSQGKALAWTGDTFPTPEGMISSVRGTSIQFRCVAEQRQSRLIGLAAVEDRRIVAEVVVDSMLDPSARRHAFPSLGEETLDTIQLQDYRKEETGFYDLLDRNNDRYAGTVSGRRRPLFVGLRAPGGNYLGFATLRGLSPDDLNRQRQGDHQVAALIALLGAFGLALAMTGLGQLDISLRGWRWPAFLFLLWSGRIALGLFPLPQAEFAFGILDPSRFALAGPGFFLRSPADFLLTAVAMAATSLVLAGAGCAIASTRRWLSMSVGGAGVLLLITMAAIGVTRIGPELVSNSSVNLLDMDLTAPSLAAFAVQLSLILALFSWLVLMLTCLRMIAAGVPRWERVDRLVFGRGDGLSLWTLRGLLPCAILAGSLYEPVLSPLVVSSVEKFFETQLMPSILTQHESRISAIQSAKDRLTEIPDLADRIEDLEESGDASLALALWRDTGLAESGYSSSLRIENPEREAVSRFALNLPPELDSDPPEHADGTEPFEERIPLLGRTRKILLARHDVRRKDHLVGAVTLHLLDEFANVPFLTPQTPYVRALAPTSRAVGDFPSSAGTVRHAVYNPDGLTVFSTLPGAPRLPPHAMTLVTQPGLARWYDTSDQESQSRSLFFSDGRNLFCLGYRHPGLVERVARSLRAILLAILLLAIGLVPALLWRVQATGGHFRERLLSALGRTQYRKLLVIFTTVTTIPLIALSALLSGYIRAQFERGVADRGLQAIRAAGDILRENIERERDFTLDDNTMYVLSLIVGEDVNLYIETEIAATSRRDPFSSGLVSPRIDGAVWRSIAHAGSAFAMGRKRLRGYEYRTITAPVHPDDPVKGGLLSLPLEAEEAEASRRTREITDVILITVVSMGLITGLFAYVLARRFSRPIRSLSMAAAAIASGDLNATVAARPRDETGDLIASFNQMALALKDQREDLERRRDYIEKILANSTIGIVSLDAKRAIVTSNPAASAILGLPSLLAGSSLRLLLSGRVEMAPLLDVLSRERQVDATEMEIPFQGSPPDRTVRIRLVPFLEGRGLLLLIEDVTETMRSNRLAAWAEMAQRIAHEIKNPLTPIQLSAEHIRRVHGEGSPDFPRVMKECLATIMAEVAKLRDISREFSSYGRTPTPQREPVPMTELLLETIRPYRAAAPPGITILADIRESLPVLRVDRTLLSRAIVNLIENGLQAMPRGGELSLSATVDGASLRIEVKDTGMGMDETSRARIFEPYFSTKDTGSGLGLAIASKTIEEHGGTIEVESAVGIGTTMRILLALS